MKQGSGKRRVFCCIIIVVVLVALLLTVFFTCTDMGRLFRIVGPSYHIEWSHQPQGYGHTLYVCQAKEGIVACALSNLTSQDAKGVVCTLNNGTELQMMRSYAENGKPKTEFLFLYLVSNCEYERNDVMRFDYKGLSHFTIQPVGTRLLILCITETDKYSGDELRQLGIDTYCEVS